MTAAYARFFRRQAREVRRAFALGAILFLGGALGLELVEVAPGPAQLERLPMLATMVTQETLEMLGVAAFLAWRARATRAVVGRRGGGGGGPANHGLAEFGASAT